MYSTKLENKLTLIEELKPLKFFDGKRNRKQRIVRCSCTCGNTIDVRYENFKANKTRSCGCLKVGRVGGHGKSYTRLYRIFAGMKQRCNNPTRKDYIFYGSKGIKISHEWEDFISFEKWSLANGYTDQLTIDRIDSDKDYCPENCQWITLSENVAKANRYRGLKL